MRDLLPRDEAERRNRECKKRYYEKNRDMLREKAKAARVADPQYNTKRKEQYRAKMQELIDSGALTKPELLTVVSGPGAEPKPWLYDSTLTPQSAGITIVLAAPKVTQGSGGKETRVVIRNDGRAEALPEEDFQRVKDYYLR